MTKFKTITNIVLVACVTVVAGFSNMSAPAIFAHTTPSTAALESTVMPAVLCESLPLTPTVKLTTEIPPYPYPPPTDPVDPVSAFTYKEDGDRMTITGYLGADTQVVVPETIWDKSVTGIGARAFQFRPDITHITIPDSVINIDKAAFSNCRNLIDIEVSETSSYFKSIDGVVFSKDGTVLVSYPMGRPSARYTIPDGVRIIGDRAFYSCRLTTLSIPSSVLIIGDNAFTECSIMSLSIPSSVLIIGEGAFSSCNYLEDITLHKGLISIGGYAFSGCMNLIDISIPDSVLNVGNSAFYFCENLVTVTVPDSVIKIGDALFDRSPDVTVICPRDSYAHQYCVSNNLRFELAEPATPVPVTTQTAAPVDDGAVTFSMRFMLWVGGFVMVGFVVIAAIAWNRKRT